MVGFLDIFLSPEAFETFTCLATGPWAIAAGEQMVLYARILKKTIRARSCLAELFLIAEKGNSAAVCLLLRQRPDAAPIRTRGGDVEVCDAFQEQFARRIAWIKWQGRPRNRCTPSPKPCPDGHRAPPHRRHVASSARARPHLSGRATRKSAAARSCRQPAMSRFAASPPASRLAFADQHACALEDLIVVFEARRQIPPLSTESTAHFLLPTSIGCETSTGAASPLSAFR